MIKVCQSFHPQTSFKQKLAYFLFVAISLISLENKEGAEKIQQLIAEELPKYKTELGKKFKPYIKIHRLSDDPHEPRTKTSIVNKSIDNNFADCAEEELADVEVVKMFEKFNTGY